MSAPLTGWKFLHPVNGGGYFTVVVAETKAKAVVWLKLWSEQQNLDADWIDNADIIEVPIDRPGVLIWIAT